MHKGPRPYPWLMLVCIALAGIGLNACAEEPANAADAGTMASTDNTEARSDGEEHSGDGERGEHARSEGGEHSGTGEHDGDGEHAEGGEHSGGEGEESGEYIGRAETWDRTRNGARLVLTFDESINTFVGRVENTTEQALCAIRVEVHLSSGTELGPTERTDLPSGESVAVELSSEGEAFDRWTAHPEMSRCAQGG